MNRHTRIMVVAHGKCEFIMAKYIRSNLRLPLEILAEQNGKSSIQISSLNRFFKRADFKSFADFTSKYDTVEFDKKSKRLLNFKIFIVMDTDDCKPQEKFDFESGEMFKQYWFFPYVIPIVSTPNIDEVFKRLKLLPTKFKDSEKSKLYNQLFPTDKNSKKKR